MTKSNRSTKLTAVPPVEPKTSSRKTAAKPATPRKKKPTPKPAEIEELEEGIEDVIAPKRKKPARRTVRRTVELEEVSSAASDIEIENQKLRAQNRWYAIGLVVLILFMLAPIAYRRFPDLPNPIAPAVDFSYVSSEAKEWLELHPNDAKDKSKFIDGLDEVIGGVSSVETIEEVPDFYKEKIRENVGTAGLLDWSLFNREVMKSASAAMKDGKIKDPASSKPFFSAVRDGIK